ncbi:MAG: restriction endonuclease subunit S [Gammaproteobacteria bacterium]|nr:restriction endonuclease subunit S [Gammaproteobacteria bacterium]
MNEMSEYSLEQIFPTSLPGEWGDDPEFGGNALVLRAADFTKDCQLAQDIGAPRHISAKKISSKRLRNGDILIEKSGGSPDQPVGRVAFFDRASDSITYLHSNFLQLLRTSEYFESKFCYYLMVQLYASGRVLRYQQQTTGIINLKLEGYLKEKVGIPSKSSQRKICCILESIDQAIEHASALIGKYQQIKAGLMHDLFTRGIGADGKLRPPREQAPDLYQQTPIGWIPKEWTYKPLKEIFGSKQITNGPFGSDLLTSELRKEGVPVLYCQDIKPGVFARVSSSNVSPQKAAQLSFCNVRKGDILLAKVGTPPCDSCIYSENEPAVVTQDVIRIRPSKLHASGFFSAWFNTGIGRQAIRRISIEGTRERVSLGEFKELLLPVPEFPEQFEMSVRLQTLLDYLSACYTEQNNLQKRKSGLMHDLLTGKVSVSPSTDAKEVADVQN